MSDSVNTFCRETDAIDRKARAQGIDTNNAEAGMAMLAWGLLRAVMECPNCPGHFRVPVDFGDGREWIHCPNCDGYWVHAEPEPEKPKRGRRSK